MTSYHLTHISLMQIAMPNEKKRSPWCQGLIIKAIDLYRERKLYQLFQVCFRNGLRLAVNLKF